MRRYVLPVCVLAAVAALCAMSAADEVVVDIGKSLRPGFAEIALLPTRLTYYNMHEDAAIASYTCCKPWQEEEIRLAAAAKTPSRCSESAEGGPCVAARHERTN